MYDRINNMEYPQLNRKYNRYILCISNNNNPNDNNSYIKDIIIHIS